MIDSDADVTTLSLLSPDKPPAVEMVNADGSSSAVLLCDHASNRVPERLGNLGLDAVQLADHIGWDPGAADVARRLSADLDAPLVLSGYSRLVIDCNRPLRSAESIVKESAGVPVPHNRGLSPAEREPHQCTVPALPRRH
jgi:predicted N-formylglutamate amidohydrolase